MYKIRYLLVVLFILNLTLIKASNVHTKVLFRNISLPEGLSQSTVLSIAQDTIGYMWFATMDGLNRYDGSHFFVYKNDGDDSTSIISNYSKEVFVDSNGKVWIGTNQGICSYNYKNDNFKNHLVYKPGLDSNINDIIEDNEGNIWAVSLPGEIFRCKKGDEKFELIKYKSNNHRLNYANALCEFGGDILIASEYGLYKLNKLNLQFEKINVDGLELKVREIIEDQEGNFWMGTEGQGLICINKELKVIKHYQHKKGDKSTLCNNRVRSLQFDESGRLWIGTFVGLSILDLQAETFTNYQEEFSRPYALSQNSVRSIYYDPQGGMWLGTFYGGIDYYHPSDIKFDIINQNGGDFSLNDNVISTIAEDSNGNVWIATNDKGLNFWNRKTDEIKYFESDELNPRTLSSNNIKSVIFTDDGRLLVGTHKSGLNLFDPKTGTSKLFKYQANQNSIASDQVYALLKDHKSQYWVGTREGLDLFNLKKEKFEHIRRDGKGKAIRINQINYLMEDSRNRILICSSGGFHILNPETMLIEDFVKDEKNKYSLPHDKVFTCLEDQKGRIWIGTKGGLCVFDEVERNFKNYTTKQGLPNNSIMGILEDPSGCLWLSTNRGLSCFNPETKSFTNYDTGDGLQSLQFNTFAFCKLSDGTFLFGGINGISLFNPEYMKESPFNDHVIISKLRVFYRDVMPGDKSKILTEHISNSPEIKLKHNQNVFAVDFAAINYIGAKKIRYLVKLDNYDKEWHYSSQVDRASYSNLLPGKYTFRVKAVSGEGIVSDRETSIDVIVLRPWWLSNWAILAYVLSLTLIIYFTLKLARERIKTQNDLRIERLEKEKLTEINKMKLEFFTNISHEFKTPLTLILSPLEKIREKRIMDDWLVKQHDMIYKNTKRLLGLIDQLMEFRKSERGQLKLKARKGDFIALINEIYLSFATVASHNNIIYTFDSKEEKLLFHFDNDVIEKIVFNLLSNAFKYTPSGGTVGIQIYRSGTDVKLEISDSGKGIDADKLSMIFERFYRIDEAAEKPGSGIGLALTKRLVELHHGIIEVESDKGKGSKFIISLPLDEGSFSPEEIEQELMAEVALKQEVIEIDSEVETLEKIEEGEGVDKEYVLIVEDNQDIIHYLEENLTEKYHIASALNGEEALKLVNEKQPDLIISDVMMPVMDGIKFCKNVKQNIKTCHIPVIMLTAKSLIDDQVEGIKSGADDYIPKPFSMSLLEAKVKNTIKTRKRLKAYYSDTMEIEPEKLAFNTLDEELLQKAKNIVEENIAEPEFSVDVFAREMGMSRSNLHLKLKSITGESATDFIKKVRFGKALQLLEQKKYSVAEISYMVGFNSPSYFSTSFKKYFGYLPTEHDSN